MEPCTTIYSLPDPVLYRILTYTAAPTHRAHVVCHQLAPLCRQASRELLDETFATTLWETILYEDYGTSKQSTVGRRACKRLKRGPVQRAREAHLMVQKNTEIAYFYLQEMCLGSNKSNRLSKIKMLSLFAEYGPHLRFNKVMSTGGNFLVELCRARHTKETTIVKCVTELLKNHDIMVDLVASESVSTSITALCVAAARGMPRLTRYLLSQHASPRIKCSGRFQLHTAARKTRTLKNCTPIEFAVAMRAAEAAAGATPRSLGELDDCIYLLQKYSHSSC